MTIKKQNQCLLLCGYALVFFLVVSSRHNGFFWDTVQFASAHPDFYLSTDFSSLLLPDSMDSGHIPAFGMYIALCWKLCGRTLEVSHWAMLPFALGIVHQASRFCQKLIPEKYTGLALLLILADPSLLSQLTLVSPDVVLVFFFFLGINAVLENKQGWILTSVFFLFLTSMRGMMVSFCLLCLDIFINVNFKAYDNTWLRLIKRSLLYLPALCLFVGYSSYHYLSKGWIGYHKDSPWAHCFERVDTIQAFFFNVGLYVWRIIDFGRIGIWMVLFFLLIQYRGQILKSKPAHRIGFLCLCLLILLPINMLWAKNLMAYRYLLPIYLAIAIFTATLLFSESVSERLKYLMTALWLLCMIGGNFIIYPPKVAQGWDSTLAHLPYYGLRDEAIIYIEKKHIDFNEVESFFPNTASLDRIELNHDPRHFENYSGRSRYVFYSNVFNVEDWKQEEIRQHYKPVKRFEKNGVCIVLYKKLP